MANLDDFSTSELIAILQYEAMRNEAVSEVLHAAVRRHGRPEHWGPK